MTPPSTIYPGHELLVDDPVGSVVRSHGPSIVGTKAQRVAYTTALLSIGKQWYETDTGSTWQWSGSAWGQLLTAGALPAGSVNLSALVNGTSGQIIVANPVATWVTPSGPVGITTAGATSISNFLTVGYQQASGVNGGQATTGSWVKYGLNTTFQNDIGISAISSNQFTLPAGTYFIFSSSFYHQNCGLIIWRLQNVTDTTTTTYSACGSDSAGTIPSTFPSVKFTIAGSKTFEIDYWANGSSTNGDLGASFAAPGVVNNYGFITLQKVA